MSKIAAALAAVDDLIKRLELGALYGGCVEDAAVKTEKRASKKAAKAAKAVKPEKPEKGAKQTSVKLTSAKLTSAKADEPTVDLLDIRVGKILSVRPHPDADSLYVEQIDMGEAEPRTVVSGLRKFVSEEAMANRLVAVVCNLKPAKMRGILSTGMVLCASNGDHTAVDPILIPEGSTIGSRIMVDGYDRAPMEQINPKKKIFERIAPDMRVSNGVCGYKGMAFKTAAGPVTATIPNASIA
jgi:methionine--tRNA ligase beta chain